MQAGDGSLGFRVAAHFHEAEALGAAGVALHHHLGTVDSAEFAELLLQIVVTERIRQIADVKLVAHDGLLKKTLKRDGAPVSQA